MAFKKSLEQFALSFSFHDGHISHICPSEQDPAWGVNLKRGILSAFQNTMPRFDIGHHNREVFSSNYASHTCRFEMLYWLVRTEWWRNQWINGVSCLCLLMKLYRLCQVDVSGVCNVDYSFDRAETNRIIILKSRDLSSCSDRHGQLNLLPGVAYDFPGVSAWLNNTTLNLT